MDEVRLFLDSNVILSGLLSTKGAPRILLDLLSLNVPLLKGLTGQYNLDEIERNLRNRFPALLTVYQEFLPRMNLEIIAVPPYETIRHLLKKMSPKDTPVLASARLGKADYLVTGDKRGFPRELAKPMRTITPADFLDKILPDLISREKK